MNCYFILSHKSEICLSNVRSESIIIPNGFTFELNVRHGGKNLRG